MKLNEKALKRIQDEMEHGEYQIPCGYENVEGMSIYHLEEHEFEPDDFMGVVVLTLKEAERVKTFLDNAVELHDKGVVVIQSTGFETIQLIKERINQEKIKQLKREISQLKKEQVRDNLEVERLKERYKNLTYSALEVGTEKCDE